MTRAELIADRARLIKMIDVLQKQFRAAMKSNAELYVKNERMKESLKK